VYEHTGLPTCGAGLAESVPDDHGAGLAWTRLETDGYGGGPSQSWGGLVTISNCGGSDVDNTCGAGSMTKVEAAGWNNRVWDDTPCCWNCECTAARWKVGSLSVYCGFSAWSAAGSTNKDGDQKMASYGLKAQEDGLRAELGGPDGDHSNAGIAGRGGTWTFDADVAGKFFEVHLTQTGADLKLDGATVHSIASAPADSQYRFGCATKGLGAGFTELAYRMSTASDLSTGQPVPPLTPRNLISHLTAFV